MPPYISATIEPAVAEITIVVRAYLIIQIYEKWVCLFASLFVTHVNTTGRIGLVFSYGDS